MSNTFPAPTLKYCGVFDLGPSGNALHLRGTPLPVCITILSALCLWPPPCFFLTRRLARGFLLFVWLLSVCHQRAHTFPTAECVILAPAVLSPSRKHTVFLMAFLMNSDTFPRRLVWVVFFSIHSFLSVFFEKSNSWWLPANSSACATHHSRALPHRMADVMQTKHHMFSRFPTAA